VSLCYSTRGSSRERRWILGVTVQGRSDDVPIWNETTKRPECVVDSATRVAWTKGQGSLVSLVSLSVCGWMQVPVLLSRRKGMQMGRPRAQAQLSRAEVSGWVDGRRLVASSDEDRLDLDRCQRGVEDVMRPSR
jgi:hypothetical protein